MVAPRCMTPDMFKATAQATSNPSPSTANSAPTVDDLARVFNSAVISTRTQSTRDFSSELYTLVQGPAYRALLAAVKQLARTEGLSEREAAETLITTFRKLDALWEDYILQEGASRIKGSGL
jgi:hypothetical protein